MPIGLGRQIFSAERPGDDRGTDGLALSWTRDMAGSHLAVGLNLSRIRASAVSLPPVFERLLHPKDSYEHAHSGFLTSSGITPAHQSGNWHWEVVEKIANRAIGGREYS